MYGSFWDPLGLVQSEYTSEIIKPCILKDNIFNSEFLPFEIPVVNWRSVEFGRPIYSQNLLLSIIDFIDFYNLFLQHKIFLIQFAIQSNVFLFSSTGLSCSRGLSCSMGLSCRSRSKGLPLSTGLS